MTGSNSGRDQFARQDMFPTDIELWKNEVRVGGAPIGNGDAFSVTSQSPVANYLIKLAEIRKTHPALANGPMLERYSKYALYVISKQDVAENREYLVAFNNSDTDEIVEVSTATSGATWTQILGKTDVTTDQNKVSFTVPALSTIVLKADSPINQYATKVTKLSTSMDDLTGFYKIKAGITSKDFLSVEFFARNVGTTKWMTQGVDTGAPYSVFLDPLDFPKKKIEVRAVARNSKGENFVLPITKLTITSP
jgi:hypothetical protein